MTEPFRCSSASRAREEPLEGTASRVRSFLLVESPGPWGVDAMKDSSLDGEVRRRLGAAEAAHGIRPLLIRRRTHGLRRGVRVFAAQVQADRPRLETALLADARELLDLDLSPLAGGRSLGLASHDEPVFLVCTHGRHDTCCAQRGRPLYAAMATSAPGHAWEVSHIGGDRFAPNVLVLPHGLYYGRLSLDQVPSFVEAQLSGRLDIEHLRGRSAYPFAVQAAEIYLRRHLGAVLVDALRLEAHSRHGVESRAVFVVKEQRWEVLVHTEPGEPRQLTCSVSRRSRALVHSLIGIRAA